MKIIVTKWNIRAFCRKDIKCALYIGCSFFKFQNIWEILRLIRLIVSFRKKMEFTPFDEPKIAITKINPHYENLIRIKSTKYTLGKVSKIHFIVSSRCLRNIFRMLPFFWDPIIKMKNWPHQTVIFTSWFVIKNTMINIDGWLYSEFFYTPPTQTT